MSSKTYTRVLDHSQAKGSARFILTLIADYADDLGFAYPGQDTLANKSKLSNRQIIRILHSLEAERELYISRRRGRGNWYLIRVGLSQDEIITAAIRHFNATVKDAEFIYRFNQQPKSSDIMTPKSSDILSQGSDIMTPKSSDILSQGSDIAMSLDPYINNKDLTSIWDDVKELLRITTTKDLYDAHLQRTQLISVNGETAVISAGKLSAQWINGRLQDVVSRALSEQLERDVLVTAVSK